MAIKPRKYWENGTPLCRAFIEFWGYPANSGQMDKTNYELLGKPAIDGEGNPYKPDYYRFTPKADFHRDETRMAYRERFCLGLANQLRTGDLIATGKKMFPERNSDVEKIPITQIPQFSARSIDKDSPLKEDPFCAEWDQNIFIGITAQYREVRISDPRLNPDGTEKRQSIPKSRKSDNTIGFDKPGRPSKGDVIRTAFEICAEQKWIDFRKPQKDAVMAVRKFIKEKMKEDFGSRGEGFSVNTIARTIKDAFNDRKL